MADQTKARRGSYWDMASRLQEIEAGLPELTQEEMLLLAGHLIERARQMAHPTEKPSGTVDWARFAGVLASGSDPLEYQKAARAEWPAH